MSDIFGRAIRFGGGFTPEGVSISIAGVVGGNALVRTVNLQYQQGLTRIWSLTDGRCYFVAGQPDGAFGFGQVAGPSGVVSAIGVVCSPATVSINASPGFCDPAEAHNFVMNNVITTGIQLAVSTPDLIINEGLRGQFTSLEVQAR